MALLTVEGVFKSGKVELTETPVGVEDSARVLVTFLPANNSKARPTLQPEDDRETLRQAAFKDMQQGLDLGGPPYPKREELYDRSNR